MTADRHMNNLPPQLAQSGRWVWVRFATLLPIPVLYAAILPVSKEYASEVSKWTPELYLITLWCSILASVVTLYFIRDVGHWKWHPMSIVPTYAALARVITAHLLVIPLAGDVYEHYRYLPITYLLYTALLCSLFDLPFYHTHRSRKLRISVDLAMAVACFIVYRGLINISWLMFLIPLCTLARYYRRRTALATTAACWIFVVLWTVLGDPHRYGSFIGEALNHLAVWKDQANTFSQLVSTGGNAEVWSMLKELGAIGAVFFLVWMIYYEEGKVRFGSIFRFGHMLDMSIRNTISASKEVVNDQHRPLVELINAQTLDFLAIETNVEAVIAVSDGQESPSVWAAFQTHGARSSVIGPEEWTDLEELRSFRKLLADIQEPEFVRNIARRPLEKHCAFCSGF